jgi:hypothetical protein
MPQPIFVESLHCSVQPEAVCLVVLAHDVGDDRLHAEKREAVPRVVLDATSVERIHRLKAEARHAARHDAILHMDGGDASWLQHAQQRGREEIHLLEEVRVRVGVPEVRVVRRVLVLRRERDRREDQADAVRFHLLRLDHAIVVDAAIASRQRPRCARRRAFASARAQPSHAKGRIPE